MAQENPNRGWVYLVFGCLAVILLLACCAVIPCVGLCGFSTYFVNMQSADVQIQAVAPNTVRSGQTFDMRVTVTNNTGNDDVFALAVTPGTRNGILELVSAQPAPDLNLSIAGQINLSYERIRAGESKSVTLKLRATGTGQMPIMVRGNIGIFKGRTTNVTISIQP
jgi:hypothetical protein